MAINIAQMLGQRSTDSGSYTPQDVARRRLLAERLRGNTVQDAGALGAIANTLSGSLAGYEDTQAAQIESEGQNAARERLIAALNDPGGGVAGLAAVASDPFLNENNSRIASTLLGQKIQQQDPAYQLDLAYKQAQIDKLAADAANGGRGNETFFGNAVPMMDDSGNVVLGQISNQGRWQPLQGAEGYSPAPTTKQIDTGTEIITTDVYGNELYRTPKQVREAAYEAGYGSVEGKAEAENDALRQSIASKLPGLRQVVDTLTQLADTATYTQSGQIMDSVKRELGLPVGQGAIDRASYIAIVDNQVLPLLRDTFGAAFTQKEGESLRATLGNPNVSPAEKKAILEAFIQQKERDILGMESNTPGGSTSSPDSGVQDWQTYFGAQ